MTRASACPAFARNLQCACALQIMPGYFDSRAIFKMGLLRLILRGLFRSPASSRRSKQSVRSAAPLQSKKVVYFRQTIVRQESARAPGQRLHGPCHVLDGDTIIIRDSRIRIAGIDAPELDHPWGNKAKWAMIHMCKGQTITAVVTGELSYDRLVATCYLPDGRDIAAELVKQGLALDWPRFSGGKYRRLEPPDARKKLWRAHAKQMGRARP